MTSARSVRLIVAALAALMATVMIACAEDTNDYPDIGARRICVWLPEGKWRNAAGDRTMFLFDRRRRIACALRPLCHGRNRAEHVAGTGKSGRTVPHFRTGGKRAQRSQACSGRGRSEVFLRHASVVAVTAGPTARRVKCRSRRFSIHAGTRGLRCPWPRPGNAWRRSEHR